MTLTAAASSKCVDTRTEAMTIAAGEASMTVAGEVDASNADRLRRSILDLGRNHGARLEVDLAAVTFMDSTGFRAMADATVTLEESGIAVVLCNVPRQVRRILEITGLGPLEVHQ